MQRWTIPLMVMFVMICLLTGSLQSAPDSDLSDRNVQCLLKRIKQLEKRVAQLEKAQPGVLFPQQSPTLLQVPGEKVTIIPQQSAIPSIPNNWKRKQINDIEYYIVPLNAKQK